MRISKLLRLTALTLLALIGASAAKAGDVTLVPDNVKGLQGSVINLPIMLDNVDANVISLQFNININANDVVYGKPEATQRVDDPTATIGADPKGSGQLITLRDNKNTPFSGSEGTLLNIPVTIDAAPGEYTVTLSDFVFTLKDDQGKLNMLYPTNTTSATVTVKAAAQDFQFYINDIKADPSTQVPLEIRFKNSESVKGFSFDLEFPANVQPVYNEEDETYIFDNSSRLKFELDETFKNNVLKVSGSTTKKANYIAAGDDAFLTIRLDVPVVPGVYTLKITNVEVTTADSEKTPADFEAELVVVGGVVTVDLVDGTPYTNTADQECASITYTRTYTSTNWQALYLPFDMDYADWADLGDIAKLNNVYQYDTDGDLKLDKTTIVFNRVTDGIKANTPYVFRPKAAGEVKFTVTDATLKAATDAYVDCSSTENVYTIYGNYAVKEGLCAEGAYALSSAGQFVQAETSEQTLKPYRIYMIVTDKTYGGSSQKAPTRISITVDGETTGIDDLEIMQEVDGLYYDLMGRPVENPQPGIYIHNGVKVYIK